MRAENTDELLLTRYLLGDLAEDEQVRVEDRAFMDPEYLAALEAVETDLIDAYVQGELATAERNAFERKFLVSPGRRGKVEFALALARVVAEAPPTSSGVAERRPAWLSRLNLFSAWGHALKVAGAMALLICAAGGAWLALENVSLRSQIAVLNAQRREFEGQAGKLQQDLSQMRSRADSLAAQTGKPPASGAVRTPLVASLVLLPGLSRAESRVGQLVLDRQVQIAHIDIRLEARDEYPLFRAILRTLSGKDVLELGSLIRRSTDSGYRISIDVPASALAAGEYELTVQGLTGGQSHQDVGYYYFRVQKR